jgi:hypothetical protein
MRITTPVLRGTSRLGRIARLSQDASKRLKWFDYYDSDNRNARLTCRYFGISPQTFYRCKRRYDPKHLETLEDRGILKEPIPIMSQPASGLENAPTPSGSQKIIMPQRQVTWCRWTAST